MTSILEQLQKTENNNDNLQTKVGSKVSKTKILEKPQGVKNDE